MAIFGTGEELARVVSRCCFAPQALSVPMAMVTYEAGVELKDLCQAAETYLTFEVPRLQWSGA